MPKSQAARAFTRTSASPAALLGESAAPEPLRLPAAAAPLGDSASKDSLSRLEGEIRRSKAASAEPMLRNALEALKKQDFKGGEAFAVKALEADERSGLGWYFLAVSREKCGDFANAIRAYESALQLMPNHADLANDLGRLAHRLGMLEIALKLFAHFSAANPLSDDGANNTACVLRDLNRYEDAIEVLKPAIMSHPANPALWNTLGSVLTEQGDDEASMTFFDEALRIEPRFAKARYNRSCAEISLGLFDQALADCDAAMADGGPPDDLAMMRLARSTILLCLGRLGEGWDDYEARLAPEFSGVTHFVVDRPKWTPETDLAGHSLLLVGEQGLGDEVLFASLIPDLLKALGPKGRLAVAVEPRLVSLFQRSFPEADVCAHGTYNVEAHQVRAIPNLDQDAFDYWTPMGSPLRLFRRRLEDFPDRRAFLTADAARVGHWRSVLEAAGPGPKVGLLWKSMKLQGARQRHFSPFVAWAPVLTTPGVTFVNLQYGDCAEELALAKSQFGVDIFSPPDIDLKKDLDDLAALSCALDLTIGFANATSNIAAACGADLWLISTPGAWTRLGTDRYPWYPQVRVFHPHKFRQWDSVMTEVAKALSDKAGTQV